jgi:hypothetical protein
MAAPLTFEQAFPPSPERGNEENEDEDDADNNNANNNNNINEDEENDNNIDVNNNHNDNQEPLVTLDTVRDNIISRNTKRSYTSDLLQFLRWVQINAIDWLTEYGNAQLSEILVRREEESARQHRARMMITFSNLLRKSPTQPIIHIDRHSLSSSRTEWYLSFKE